MHTQRERLGCPVSSDKKNSPGSSKKVKMELPFDPAIPLLRTYPKNSETPMRKNICTPMFIAALLTLAKIWEQPKCPSVDEWIKKKPVVHSHRGILCSSKKRSNPTLCNSMDRTGEHYAKLNKLERERLVSHDLTHMWNLMNKIN
ncbi:unnamed protein product [Pipistrellus nathusii]|uniref:Uncharacterized protein n=1 Tax=Pipistrellus nathusii TaxID=59473 RepID=A0ABP0AAC2_PIPNA